MVSQRARVYNAPHETGGSSSGCAATVAAGVAGLRLGVLKEGFDEAQGDVRALVLAAVNVLAQAGAKVSKMSIPAHHACLTPLRVCAPV